MMISQQSHLPWLFKSYARISLTLAAALFLPTAAITYFIVTDLPEPQMATLVIVGLSSACFLGMLIIGLVWFRAIKKTAASLIALEEFREALYEIIAHNLKNPLTSITGFLNLCLREQKITDPIRNYLKLSLDSSRQLLEMIQSITDVIRLEDGRMTIEWKKFDISSMLPIKVDQYRDLAKNAGLDLRCESPAEEVIITTDFALVIRIIENLMTNAIRHTPLGGEVKVLLRPSPEAGTLRIQVKDTGVGILPEAIPQLFRKYGHVTLKNMGARYDAGLSLIFCRLAAEGLGGKISVESEPGRGNTFTVELPLAPASSEK